MEQIIEKNTNEIVNPNDYIFEQYQMGKNQFVNQNEYIHSLELKISIKIENKLDHISYDHENVEYYSKGLEYFMLHKMDLNNLDYCKENIHKICNKIVLHANNFEIYNQINMKEYRKSNVYIRDVIKIFSIIEKIFVRHFPFYKTENITELNDILFFIRENLLSYIKNNEEIFFEKNIYAGFLCSNRDQYMNVLWMMSNHCSIIQKDIIRKIQYVHFFNCTSDNTFTKMNKIKISKRVWNDYKKSVEYKPLGYELSLDEHITIAYKLFTKKKYTEKKMISLFQKLYSSPYHKENISYRSIFRLKKNPIIKLDSEYIRKNITRVYPIKFNDNSELKNYFDDFVACYL